MIGQQVAQGAMIIHDGGTTQRVVFVGAGHRAAVVGDDFVAAACEVGSQCCVDRFYHADTLNKINKGCPTFWTALSMTIGYEEFI